MKGVFGSDVLLLEVVVFTCTDMLVVKVNNRFVSSIKRKGKTNCNYIVLELNNYYWTVVKLKANSI